MAFFVTWLHDVLDALRPRRDEARTPASASQRATKFWLTSHGHRRPGRRSALWARGQMHLTNRFGMEMMVVAAVVLGGTAIAGVSKGSLTGVMLGTLLIVIVQTP